MSRTIPYRKSELRSLQGEWWRDVKSKCFPEYIGKRERVEMNGTEENAYIPQSLPLSPPLARFSNQIDYFLRRAEMALEKLDKLTPKYSTPLLECLWENAIPPLSRVEAGAKESHEERWENFGNVLKYGWDRDEGGKTLDHHFIQEMHGQLRGLKICKGRGKYRTEQNVRGIGNHADYVPPPVEYVRPLMENLIRYTYSSPHGMDTIVHSGIVFAQFFMIHPFGDGNTRIGNILVSLLLQESGKIKTPLVYFSHFLKSWSDVLCRPVYRIFRRGNWLYWLCFYLRGIEEVAEHQAHVTQLLSKESSGGDKVGMPFPKWFQEVEKEACRQGFKDIWVS